jgi:hypothetical protein
MVFTLFNWFHMLSGVLSLSSHSYVDCRWLHSPGFEAVFLLNVPDPNRMLILPEHLIPPLVRQGVRVCPSVTSVVVMRLIIYFVVLAFSCHICMVWSGNGSIGESYVKLVFPCKILTSSDPQMFKRFDLVKLNLSLWKALQSSRKEWTLGAGVSVFITNLVNMPYFWSRFGSHLLLLYLNNPSVAI